MAPDRARGLALVARSPRDSSEPPHEERERMKASYADSDFRRSMDIVGGNFEPSALSAGLGVEWDYLAWLGIGLAQEVLGEFADQPDALANGAEAFTAGFLIGGYLPEGRERRKGNHVPHAVEHVRERGRHAVIAEYCDLATVARFEQVYAEALVDGIDAPEVERAALLGPVTMLFESGLATGLVLGDVVVPASAESG